MWFAQLFIYFIYMFYGLFMYGYQGQYVVNPSYLGIGKYSIQTAGNSFAMASALIAAALYGNIGVKGTHLSPFPQRINWSNAAILSQSFITTSSSSSSAPRP